MYEQALAIAREIGDRQGEANHLGNLGICYADLGQTQRAIELLRAGLAIAREIGDRQGEADHLGNLGGRYADLGQTRRAIDLYEQALAIVREIGDRRGEADPWATWASAMRVWGRPSGRSTCMSRRWPSAARSAFGSSKRMS